MNKTELLLCKKELLRLASQVAHEKMLPIYTEKIKEIENELKKK